MKITHLRQRDLAERWGIDERTLEGHRYRGIGAPYLKISGRVVYRLADIEAFEEANLHLSFSGNDRRDKRGF